ncbi:MAG: hypothetical protein J6Y78_16665 [Paludibacteraceae bacterium]|nr:hypothetical protein [Paludibacteraceae bacterium]
MSENRFTIKPQDDYWAVVDNHNEDKVCIINGIHTEIEAEWLCDFMNEQQDQIDSLIVDKRILVDNVDKARLYIKAKDRCIKHQQATIEQLRTQLLICQQSKSDDGRIKVWQVPPIPKGMRITTSTTSDGEKDE